MLKVLLLSLTFLVGDAFAEGTKGLGADVLLNSAGTSKSSGSGKSVTTVSLNNPLMVHFFALNENETKLKFHQKRWAQLVLSQKWEKVAHLWTVMKKSFHGRFAMAARAVYVYSLWELGAGQTFWNEWFEMARIKKYRNSKAFDSLNLSIHREFPQRFFNWAIEIEQDSVGYLFSDVLDINPVYDTIRAHVLLRQVASRVEYAQKLFVRLSEEHPYYIPLGRTLVLHFSRKGDLSTAGSILKKMEKPILREKDSEKIASHYLQIARLLYQNGNLDAAVVFYKKIPKGSQSFLVAREEHLWALLQMGDYGHLRGELETFRMDVWKEQFLPEIHLVSAIANLKLCFYGKVKQDFDLFLKNNRRWAKRIEAELKKPNPVAPQVEDFYITMAEMTFDERTKERASLEKLASESKTAALPA